MGQKDEGKKEVMLDKRYLSVFLKKVSYLNPYSGETDIERLEKGIGSLTLDFRTRRFRG